MKKIVILIAAFIFGSTALRAQSAQQIKNLAAFAKVWGFLKYYHPEAAKGRPDWDSELVKMIPQVKAASTDEAFDKLITNWYYALPKAKYATRITQLKNDTIVRVFDETEIGNFGISQTLRNEFTRLYLYHIPDSSKYINNFDGKYHYDYIFHNEEPFAKPAYPDEEHRLLGLFRYWNIINYFYPHKKTQAPNWPKVLADNIAPFVMAKDSNEYRIAFYKLTTNLKDSHSFFSQAEWRREHAQFNLPFELSYIDNNYYITKSRCDSLMTLLDFKIGDEIVGINNKPVIDRINALKPFTTGTNELSFYRNIGNRLFKIDTVKHIQLTIKRRGMLIDKKVPLYNDDFLYKYQSKHTPKLWESIGNGIWYVRVCEITNPDTLKKLFTDIHDAKAVIWEMRAYPSFKVMQQIAPGLFAKIKQEEFDYNGILEFPGSFAKHKSVGTDKINTLKLNLYTGKLIVLVSEQTQSLAESVAAELRTRPSTMVMGRQTAGTTGNITSVDYPGKIEAYFTAVGVEAINGNFIEGKGVKIDKEIKLNGQDLPKFPDYMLEMAYREALKGL